jgi:hypothetical protein
VVLAVPIGVMSEVAREIGRIWPKAPPSLMLINKRASTPFLRIFL